MAKGLVFDISRFRVDDGPGVRTAVFLKGCPLRCLWCHNPESNACQKELAFDPAKCVCCRACETVCPNGCHSFSSTGIHLLRRTACTACGNCENACMYDALRIYGREMDSDTVMKTVRRDTAFYHHSGGGLTISGGEPLLQADFTISLLKAARLEGIHTCIETCGFAEENVFLEVVKQLDMILFDCKAVDSRLHQKLTGVGNEKILKNLRLADKMGIPIVLRVPVIPGCNDSVQNLQSVGQLADSLSHIKYLEIMPYHPLGLAKAKMIGKESGYTNGEFPNEDKVNEWKRIVQTNTYHTVKEF